MGVIGGHKRESLVVPINTDTGITLAHHQRILDVTAGVGGDVTITVPAAGSLPDGFECVIRRNPASANDVVLITGVSRTLTEDGEGVILVADSGGWVDYPTMGPTGADGAAGPNEVSTSTDCSITGLLKGDGSKVAAAALADVPINAGTDIGEALADTDELGVYNASAAAVGKTAVSRLWTYIWGKITGLAAKATPIDADSIVVVDSADGNAGKLTTWTQVKAFLKTYFDTLYGAAASAHTQNTDTGTDNTSFTVDNDSATGKIAITVDSGAADKTLTLSNEKLTDNRLILLQDADGTLAFESQLHGQQHALTSTSDHTSTATAGKMLKADANGLPVDATNTDSDVADAVTKKHTQNTDSGTTGSDFTVDSDATTGKIKIGVTPGLADKTLTLVNKALTDNRQIEFPDSDGTVALTTDAPAAHAASHQSGGADAIKLDDLSAPDDNTDLDVSTSKHGLCPKAPNDTTKFLRGDATWDVPAGGATDDPGTMKMTACAAAPTGWLLCDGGAISRTTYADLFSAIGTTYGAGDGSTTFNVPDFRGRSPMGVGTGTGGGASGTGLPTGGSALTAVARATWKGAETHVLSVAELASHGHTSTALLYKGGSPIVGYSAGAPYSSGYSQTYATDTSQNSGSDSAHNNIQPVIGVNFIIKT